MKLLKEDINNKLTYEDTKNLNDKYYDLAWDQAHNGKIVSDELVNAIRVANEAVGKLNQLYYNEIEKPKRDAEAKKEQERLDKTAMKINLTQAEADLCDVVLGQLSDGYWENSKAAEKYWKNINVNGTTLVIDSQKLKWAFPYSQENEFTTVWQDANKIKKWFARRAQIVQNADMKDNFGTLKLTPEQWDSQAQYLDRGVNQTYRQVQDAIDSLKK